VRFCAKIISKGCLQLFIHSSGATARLAEVCVLRLCPDKLRFGPRAPGRRRGRAGGRGEAGSLLRQLPRVSEELREMCLELTLEHSSRAVRSAGDAAPEAPADRRGSLASCAAALVAVHGLPVRALPEDWKDCPEPSVRASDVPALKTPKSVVERVANLGDPVLVEANPNGQRNLSIGTDVVRIKSYFKNLGNAPKSALDWENMVQVWVDNRKLLQIFQGQRINPTTAICNIFSNLRLVLVHEAVSLQYFIPAS
uniref:Checkpoint protein n=1 Tax=Propithecus coquereli TaxID=379532 RepID=A0A2K6FKA6_PROCO